MSFHAYRRGSGFPSGHSHSAEAFADQDSDAKVVIDQG